jgi:hypothetical protein
MKFLNSKHALYDVIYQIFKHYLQSELKHYTNEVNIHGMKYIGPYEPPTAHTKANKRECSEKNHVKLNELDIAPKDCFQFLYDDYDQTKIEFYITAISTPTAEDLMMTDPVAIPDTRVFDPNAAQLYTDEELAESRRYRDQYENTKKYQWLE